LDELIGAGLLMASETSDLRLLVRPRRHVAAAFLLSCCVFLVACTPVAAARLDHSRPPFGAGTSGTSAPPNPLAPPNPQEAPDTEPPGNSPVSPRHAGHLGTPPGDHRYDSAHHQEGDPGDHQHQASPSTGNAVSVNGNPNAEKKTSEGSSPAHVPGGERKNAKSPRAKSQRPVVSGKVPDPSTAVSAPVTIASTVVPSTTATAVPSAAVPTTTATVPPQVVEISQPAGTGRSAHPARDTRHRNSRTSRRVARATFSKGVSSPVAGIPATGVRAARARRARKAAHRPPTHGHSSPIVTTITRIVSVVPTLVWSLIGALVALALALAVRSRISALRARRLEHQRGELLEDVGVLQAALLPVPPARLGPVGTSVAYRPADGPGAGGDFYDVFALEEGQLGVIVGDVSGHGRQALPYTALVRFTLRAYLEAGLSPRVAVQTAGAVLGRQLGGSLATVVAATYQPRERVLTYACAGHPPPLVLGSESISPITACSSPPIGAGIRTGTRQTVVSVPGHSQVCFHTDGVTEARVEGELFGAQRLARALGELGPRTTAAALLDRVAEETDARPDDMAACLLDVEGDTVAPVILTEELELDHDGAASDRTEHFLLACGVERLEVAEIMRSARAAAGRAGTVEVEVRLADGPPEVTLQRANVAVLHPHASRRADLMVSQ
jgi:hypothetical protein